MNPDFPARRRGKTQKKKTMKPKDPYLRATTATMLLAALWSNPHVTASHKFENPEHREKLRTAALAATDELLDDTITEESIAAYHKAIYGDASVGCCKAASDVNDNTGFNVGEGFTGADRGTFDGDPAAADGNGGEAGAVAITDAPATTAAPAEPAAEATPPTPSASEATPPAGDAAPPAPIEPAAAPSDAPAAA